MNTIFISIATISLLGLSFGLILGYASRRFYIEENPVVEQINELLPQSQCGQCGYPGCRPYAEAVSCNVEKINCCVPGGKSVMLKISKLLNVEIEDLIDKSEFYEEKIRTIAIIDEENCIGCTKCIQVCPVDAIIGAARMMHTVIINYCTGCNLCVARCPTKCIKSIELRQLANYTHIYNSDNYRASLQTIPLRFIE